MIHHKSSQKNKIKIIIEPKIIYMVHLASDCQQLNKSRQKEQLRSFPSSSMSWSSAQSSWSHLPQAHEIQLAPVPSSTSSLYDTKHIQQMLGSMTGDSLDRSVLLDLGSVCEVEAKVEDVVSGIKEFEVTESDVEVMRLPRALTFDVLLFLFFSNAFSCLFQQPSSFFLQLSSSPLRLLTFFCLPFPFFLF